MKFSLALRFAMRLAHDFRFIIVSGCRNDIVFISISARQTGMKRISLFLASCDEIGIGEFMPHRFQNFCLYRIFATTAFLSAITFFRTSRRNFDFFIVVSERRHERIVISRPATRTNMRCITLLQASRFYNLRLIIMTERAYDFRFGLRTTRAFPLLDAACRTSRFRQTCPLPEIVSRCLRVRVRIGMTAPFTLVNSVSSIRTGRIYNVIYITMTERVRIPFVNVRTYRTRSLVFSQVYASMLFYGCPLAVFMSFGFDKVIRIGVAAGFASISRIALRRTGRLYDFTLVVVSFRFNKISVVTISATRTFIYSITFLRAGRRNHRIPCVVVIYRKFIRCRTVGVVGDYKSVFALLFNPSSACIAFPVQRCIAVTRRPNHANFMTVVRLHYRCFGRVDTHIHITSIAPVAETVHRVKPIRAVYRRFWKDDAWSCACHKRSAVRRFVIQRYPAVIIRSGYCKPVFQSFSEPADRTRNRRSCVIHWNRIGLRSVPRVIHAIERIRAVCRQLRSACVFGITRRAGLFNVNRLYTASAVRRRCLDIVCYAFESVRYRNISRI